MIARYVSLAVLILLMLILGITFYQVLIPFLLPLFLAAVVALIAQPVYIYFYNRTGKRASWAAGLATSAIVAAFVVPLFVGITIGALQLFITAEHLLTEQSVQKAIELVKQGEIYHYLTEWGERFFPLFTEKEMAELTPEQQLALRDDILEQRAQGLKESVQGTLRKIAVTTFTAGTALTTVDIITKLGWSLMALATFIMALYYFFCEGPKLIEYAIELIPVDVNHQRQLFDEFGKAIRAVVSATFLAAIAQGIATSAMLWLLGFNHFFLFAIVSTLAALIPLAGTWLVWLPCAGYLVYSGDWGWALLLAVYGFGVVGTLDNVIRAYVLHSDAKLHPLLAFVSVLGGIQVMGLWGVFIAPVVACCLYALIRIFNEELFELSRIQKNKLNAEETQVENTSLQATAVIAAQQHLTPES